MEIPRTYSAEDVENLKIEKTKELHAAEIDDAEVENELNRIRRDELNLRAQLNDNARERHKFKEVRDKSRQRKKDLELQIKILTQEYWKRRNGF